MNVASRFLLTAALVMASLSSLQAHCLVFRAKFVSAKISSDTSAADPDPTLAAATTSIIFVLDLEKEYEGWSWNANSSLNTQTDYIWVDDGSTKTFSFGDDRHPGSKGYSGWTKFGFFKSGAYFYFFNSDLQDFGNFGFDYGSFSVSGPCTSSLVNIGGGNRSLKIPADFVGVQSRADSGKFQTNVGNFSVDTAMTKAVNDFLYSNGLISASGSNRTPGSSGGVYDTTTTTSTVIKRAKNYICTTYLPKAGYTSVPW